MVLAIVFLVMPPLYHLIGKSILYNTPSSVIFVHLSKSTSSCSTVEHPCRNPNCFSLNRLLFVMCFIIWSHIIDSIILQAIQVMLTGLQLFGFFLSPFLNNAVTFACLQSLVIFPLSKVVWYRMVNGLSRTLLISLSTLGCMLSGDLHGFNLDSFFLTSSWVMVYHAKTSLTSLSCIIGILSTFSFANALEKNTVSTSAFSASSLVSLLEAVSNSAIPVVVLVLLFMYYQNFLGLVLALSATSFFLHLCLYLVAFRTLFLSLQYALCLSSSE